MAIKNNDKIKTIIGILIFICLITLSIVYIVKRPAPVNKVVGISKSFKSAYKMRSLEVLGNTTRPEVKIIIAKISLPNVLSDKEIIDNLKTATVEIYNREKPYRIAISAYDLNDNSAAGIELARSDFGQANFDAGKDVLNLKNYKFKSTILRNKKTI